MNDAIGGGVGRPPRVAVLAAAIAATALLATACGGSHAPGTGSSPGQALGQRLASYTRCMHDHGEPNLYFVTGSSSPGPGLYIFGHNEWTVQGADPSSPQYQAADGHCSQLLPTGTAPSAAQQHQQFSQAVKAAACMRAHGYPDWPDPAVRNGRVLVGPGYIPAGVDVNSPQLQSTAKACRMFLPPGGP